MTRPTRHGLCALALACCATASAAEDFNSFVIEVPYDLSVPAKYTSAMIGCEFINAQNPQSFRPNLVTEVALSNGQAQGMARFGYDVIGTTPDLVSFNDDQIARFRSIYKGNFFELAANCAVLEFKVGTERFGVYHVEVGSAHIVDSARQPVETLDETSVTSFVHRLTPTDNAADAAARPAASTATAAPISPGLEGLQSILEGQ